MRLVQSFLFIIIFLFVAELKAQERCAQVAYEKMIHPSLKREAAFEQWMKQKTALKKLQSKSSRTQSGPYTIPVVVHIIHNGEPIGTGTNISDAQILSQIDVLNKDYKRLNADASNTPSEFLPVAGSMDIQFVLAKQDPVGLATNGIVRVKGTKSGWTFGDNSQFKALSYWRADRYLNIWVINFTDDYLGFAQLPLPGSTGLSGLEDSPNDSLTDGVAIDYKAFGSDADGSFTLESRYNKGRTTTHEVGHFFGLRHIWGDGSSCSATDYVDDTPTQDGATRTCPTSALQSCGHNKMYQNYLDYTDDNCMNLFTVKQIERMDVVINNCVRRTSLLTSPGATAPAPVANDLGIKSIVSPKTSACAGDALPLIQVQNTGSNTITSCRIVFRINNNTIETHDFIDLDLSPLATINLAFSSLTLPSAANQSFEFEVLLVNNVTDSKAGNNKIAQTIISPANGVIPINELFGTTPSSWAIQNIDGLKTWQNVSLASNKAMMLNFYDYENEGTLDRLITPALNLTAANSPLLKFDYAYGAFPGTNTDSLKVLIITDCGADMNVANIVFNKGGSSMATANSTSNSFTPTSSSQWKTETISLLPYIGQSNVQIAFVGTNGYGNNLYLDNVFVVDEMINDLAITELKSPAPVFCIANPQPVVKIKNQGSTVITSFKIETTVNNQAAISQSFNAIQLSPGTEKEFTLNALSLTEGQSTITFNVKEPNGQTDNVAANNTLRVTRAVNSSTDLIPLRQNFDGSFADSWTIISQDNARKWEKATTNYNTSLFYSAFANVNSGQQSWLVSPVLDFTQASEASVFFDVSYATRSTTIEQLQLVASTDCGLTYPTILYDKKADQFDSGSSNTAWTPSKETDWQKEFINLDALAGEPNVRLAFVIINQNGNNLYIDNLDFFTDNNSSPPKVETPYYIYASSTLIDEYAITFNLEERTNASIYVFNLLGQKVAEHHLPNILNQTYPLDLSGQTAGIYIIKTQVGDNVSSSKIFVNR